MEVKHIIDAILSVKDKFRVSNLVMADMLFRLRADFFDEEEFGSPNEWDFSKDPFCQGYKKSYKKSQLLAPKGEWIQNEKNDLYLSEYGREIYYELEEALALEIKDNGKFKLIRIRYIQNTAEVTMSEVKVF